MKKQFSLIETLGYFPEKSPVRISRHLDRLQASAREFGFYCDRDKVHSAVIKAVDGAAPSTPLRIRLELSQAGELDIRCTGFVPAPVGTVYRIAVAATQITSDNPLIRHKTTERSVYEEARSEFPAETVDEVVLTNERMEICEGTISNLFLRMEKGALLKTPALTSGLLPGVLRQEMLENELAEEAVLHAGDLLNAHEVHIGNSLRGLIPAKIAGAGT